MAARRATPAQTERSEVSTRRGAGRYSGDLIIRIFLLVYFFQVKSVFVQGIPQYDYRNNP